jgi:hypothetical protein
MTLRKPTRKQKRKQVPLTDRIRIRFYGRHESLKQIAKALRVPVAKVRGAWRRVVGARKPVRSRREAELEAQLAKEVARRKRAETKLRKRRQASTARGLVDQSVRKLFAEKLGKPGAYTIERWRRELRKMTHEERVAFISKHYKKISSKTGLSPKEVFALGISP